MSNYINKFKKLEILTKIFIYILIILFLYLIINSNLDSHIFFHPRITIFFRILIIIEFFILPSFIFRIYDILLVDKININNMIG